MLPATSSWGAEPLDVAKAYKRIVADYGRTIKFARNSVNRAVAGGRLTRSAYRNLIREAAVDRAAARRLTRDAYRNLIHKAANVKNLNAADLHALGQCYEAIGDAKNASAFYAKSLAAKPLARTHLSLVRTNLKDDLKSADLHFAKAAKLDPMHPDLNRFRASLAVAHQHNQDWNDSAKYLEHLLKYTKTMIDRAPTSSRVKAGQIAVQKQLDRVRRFDSMTGKAAHPLKVKHWAQGGAVSLAGLKGKVVLVDFCAMWSKSSRDRMEFLKTVRSKYGDDQLEVIGLTLAYNHKYNPDTDMVKREDKLPAKEELTGIAAFAKKHKIPWPLGMIGRDVVEEYGVSTLPHTVVINREGNVAAILFGGDNASEDLNKIA